MATCKQCGRDFVYEAKQGGRGYAANICGPVCDGLFAGAGERAKLAAENDRLLQAVEELAAEAERLRKLLGKEAEDACAQ